MHFPSQTETLSIIYMLYLIHPAFDSWPFRDLRGVVPEVALFMAHGWASKLYLYF